MDEIIKQMPKVELHLHLEGAFTFEFLFDQIRKYGGVPEIQSVAEMERKFVFRDFPHFIETWIDFEQSTYHTLENLSRQNVVYAEVFYSPWDFVRHGISVAEITKSTLAGIDQARRDFGIECRLIADLIRDFGAGTAIERLDEITPFLGKTLIGIGIGGSEQEFPPAPFKPVYDEARRRGFRLTAHAGEAAGPKSVRDAVDILGAERIGHGVRAVEDPALVAKLNERQIPLDICVTSNLKTNIFKSAQEHPIRRFFDQGLLVTVNSDDPAMFGATITDELLLLHNELGFTLHELHQLQLNAVASAFLTSEEKTQYHKIITG